MSYSLRVLIFTCMAIGVIIFIDLFVFDAIEGINYSDYTGRNKAYVAHFPSFLKTLLGEEGVLFRFASAFLLLVLPGLILLNKYSTSKKQFYLTWGLIGTCVGAIMIWMNM